MPSKNVTNLGIPIRLYDAYRSISRQTRVPIRGLITKALQDFLQRIRVTPRGTLEFVDPAYYTTPVAITEPCPPPQADPANIQPMSFPMPVRLGHPTTLPAESEDA